MSNKTFYSTLITICVICAVIFLAGDSNDAFIFLFSKLIGIALIILSAALYESYKDAEAKERRAKQ